MARAQKLRRLRSRNHSSCSIFCIVFVSLCSASDVLAENSFSPNAACVAEAEAQIIRAPDKHEFHPTTSWLFKRDLASFFCQRYPQNLTVLELGVFRGYTTAVLSAIFGRVFAADVESEYLEASARHNSDRKNLVFLAFDSYADDWRLFQSNHVDVVFVDADHKYEKVRADAANALAYLKPVSFLVFDDFGMEADVRQAVQELEQVNAIRDCVFIGEGKDGQPWQLKDWGQVDQPEGVICQRGTEAVAASAKFDHPYLVYIISPKDPLIRAEGVLRFIPDGDVWTSRWGSGKWWLTEVPDPRRFILNMSLRMMPPGSWEVVFNRPRSAFLLTAAGNVLEPARWLGMRADKINQVFDIANEQFGEV